MLMRRTANNLWAPSPRSAGGGEYSVGDIPVVHAAGNIEGHSRIYFTIHFRKYFVGHVGYVLYIRRPYYYFCGGLCRVSAMRQDRLE